MAVSDTFAARKIVSGFALCAPLVSAFSEKGAVFPSREPRSSRPRARRGYAAHRFGSPICGSSSSCLQESCLPRPSPTNVAPLENRDVTQNTRTRRHTHRDTRRDAQTQTVTTRHRQRHIRTHAQSQRCPAHQSCWVLPPKRRQHTPLPSCVVRKHDVMLPRRVGALQLPECDGSATVEGP
jgi:hypothetical protein